jgi:lipopolysaccharide export system protein LptA
MHSKGGLMTFRTKVTLVAALFVLASTGGALAQSKIAFGGLKADPTLPVEVTSESFSVDTADGSAVFNGNVVVGQGTMRLAAKEVRVIYAKDSKKIESLKASGGVTLTNAAESAEAEEAVYTIDSGVVVMTGNVLLTQGASAMSAQKLTINLTSGTGVLEGSVKTTFSPGGGN